MVAAAALLLGYRVVGTPASTAPAVLAAAAPDPDAGVLPPVSIGPRPSGIAALKQNAGSGQHTLCGHGDYEPTGSYTGLPEQVDAQARLVLADVARQLAAGEPHSQAIGLTLQALLPRFAVTPLQLDADKASIDSFMTAAREAEAAAAPARAALVRLALGSRDAVTYRQAYLTCRAAWVPDPHCAQLDAREWARRDPGDGSAWLHVAQDARAADAALRDEAYFRFTTATHMSGGSLLPMDRLSAMPAIAEAPMPARIGAIMQLMLMIGASPMPPGLGLTDYCGQRAAAGSEGRQRCSEIAESLLRHGRDPMSMMMAQVAGHHAGWPQERLQALRDQADALLWAEHRLAGDPALWASCDGFAAARPWLERFGSPAHVAQLQDTVRAAGVPAAELARRLRDELRQAAAREAARDPAPAPR
jgi:hypothetical protein